MAAQRTFRQALILECRHGLVIHKCSFWLLYLPKNYSSKNFPLNRETYRGSINLTEIPLFFQTLNGHVLCVLL